MSRYISQKTLRTRQKALQSFDSRLDELLYDLSYSGYPQDFSHLDFLRIKNNERFAPYGFLNLQAHTLRQSLDVFCDGNNVINAPDWFCLYLPVDVYKEDFMERRVRVPCVSWSDLCRKFFGCIWQFVIDDCRDFQFMELRIGAPSQFQHLTLKLCYHHYRYYVSYYGFSFGDESDDRYFVQHVVCKTKDIAEANVAYRKLLLDFMSAYVLPVPECSEE